jgi:hypothetical protein
MGFMIKIGEYILTDETIKEMVELIDKAKISKREYGGIIYNRKSDNNLLLKDINSGSDYVVVMIQASTDKLSDPVGDFHVHIDNELPSFLDFDTMKKDSIEMMFIAGANNRKIKCYIAKNIDAKFLDGIDRLRNIFKDFMKKSEKENHEKILKEFHTIHDPLIRKLIREYFDVIDIL